MCPTFIFEKLTYKYENLRNLTIEKNKVNPFIIVQNISLLKLFNLSILKFIHTILKLKELERDLSYKMKSIE